jgi:hypothetical protein
MSFFLYLPVFSGLDNFFDNPMLSFLKNQLSWYLVTKRKTFICAIFFDVPLYIRFWTSVCLIFEIKLLILFFFGVFSPKGSFSCLSFFVGTLRLREMVCRMKGFILAIKESIGLINCAYMQSFSWALCFQNSCFSVVVRHRPPYPSV